MAYNSGRCDFELTKEIYYGHLKHCTQSLAKFRFVDVGVVRGLRQLVCKAEGQKLVLVLIISQTYLSRTNDIPIA